MLKNADIHLRDPFVMVYEGKYYLYGTRGRDARSSVSGFDVYTGDDLVSWTGPRSVFEAGRGFWGERQFWAPEVHEYRGRFYMFASFAADGRSRASHVLVSGRPDGPFVPLTDAPVTPDGWECLDATLFVGEDGRPYMVFCREWLQIGDGTVCCVPLKEDLSARDGEPEVLFSGSSNPLNGAVGHPRFGKAYVTDGPFLWRTADGRLLMLWSSVGRERNYQLLVSESSSGTVRGPWRHFPRPLFSRDGGHGMLFRDLCGGLVLTIHRPNSNPDERPAFFRVVECGEGLRILSNRAGSFA